MVTKQILVSAFTFFIKCHMLFRVVSLKRVTLESCSSDIHLSPFARACCYLLFNSNLKFKFFLRQNTRHIINLITRSQKAERIAKKFTEIRASDLKKN